MLGEQTGERLKKIAEILFQGNQSDMARMMGMSPQAMNKYFQGDRVPGIKILKRLVSLGVNATWVISGIKPMMIDKEQAGVITINPDKDRKPLPGEKEESETGTDTTGQEKAQKEMPDFFAHINEEELTEAEQSLLAEARQFSDFLKTAQLPFQVKRLMLQLMIEHIDQEIVRLQNKDS